MSPALSPASTCASGDAGLGAARAPATVEFVSPKHDHHVGLLDADRRHDARLHRLHVGVCALEPVARLREAELLEEDL